MQIKQITFTRFLAAVYVFIFHFGFSKDIYPFSNHFFYFGSTSVSYFYLLSGFILAYVYFKKENNHELNNKDFWVARFSRIYPIYLIALLLIIFTYLFLWKEKVPVLNAVLQAFLIQSWVPGRELTLNYPGWSLSDEAVFYFLFPMVFRFFIKFEKKRLMVTALLIYFISQLVYVLLFTFYFSPNVNYNPLLHLGTFFIGMLAGIYFVRYHAEINKLKKYSNLMIVAPLAIIFMMMMIPNKVVEYHHNGLFAPLYIIVLFGLSINEGFFRTVFSKKILIYLGEISYGIYILQVPALYITRYIHDKIGLIYWDDFNFYYHLSVLIIISALSYNFIQVPVQDRIRKAFTQ